jgi:NAD(P)-dependent dehydrogenase (short-subunit alcohol dehydrogenase family)
MREGTVTLVTGANRGLGLEVCRQLLALGQTVILGSRDAGRGEAAARSLMTGGGGIYARQLDVADPHSVEALRSWVGGEFGRLDVLINNAGFNYDAAQRAVSVDLDSVRETLETNTYGAWRMCQAFLPLLRQSRHGRIVNVSSEAGSLAAMGGGTPAYSVSKAALNALTRLLAGELKNTGILVNSVCPGWAATEMGGSGGRPVAAGAASVVWAATLPDGGPTGGFFRDGKPLAW